MSHTIIPVTKFAQNCSLLVCDETRQAVVIDPGGDIDRILSEAEQAGATVEKILITHFHMDHASAAGSIAAKTGAPILGSHHSDLFLLDAMPRQCIDFGLPPMQPFTPDRWLQHGDTVSFGKQTIEVLHCPGHTPGHLAYFHRPSKLAMVGDILFRGSVGVTKQSYGDHNLLVQSIRERLFPLGDNVKFVPGHGPTSTFGMEREFNPFVADDLFF